MEKLKDLPNDIKPKIVEGVDALEKHAKEDVEHFRSIVDEGLDSIAMNRSIIRQLAGHITHLTMRVEELEKSKNG